MNPIPVHAFNPGPMTGAGNWTWLLRGRVPTLIDAGTGENRHLDAVEEALAGTALAQVLVTHAHGDHASGVVALAQRFRGARFLKMPWDERDGRWYHTMRDLRNGNVVQNVTQKSARKLWHYAISQREKGALDMGRLTWVGDMALVNRSARAGKQRYDLAQRLPDGSIRIYYGVTEDGIHGPWRRLAGLED